MKTNDLITLLAQDAPVVVSLNQALVHAAIAATLIAGVAFFSFIGLRSDIGTALESGRFLFKFVFTIALAASAGTVLFRIGKPGVSVRTWAMGLFLPVALIAGAAMFELTVLPGSSWEAHMVGHNARLCLTIIPSLSIAPLACFLYAMRCGAPQHPALAGAVAGLAAAGIAGTFYAANCDDDSPLFVMLWYPIAIAAVAVVGALVGRYVLRW